MGKGLGSTLGQAPHRLDTLSGPRSDVFAPPSEHRRLPVRSTSASGAHRPGWLFVSAHGGSGAGLLSRLSGRPDGADDCGTGLPAFGISTGRAWPDPRLEPTELVVVVAQTTMRGLAWARDVAAQYLSDAAPDGLCLLGLVTIADQPGRLPPSIAAARRLLAGAYPRTWQVPYVAEYRLFTGLTGEGAPPSHPAVEDVLAAIRSTIDSRGPKL